MFGFQTLACLHDIPIVRSSTDKIQDVYVKAKYKSSLIRLPCHLAETVADKSLKLACTVANPFVKPFSGPVRIIDDYAAKTIRGIEAKYPVIKTPTEQVMNTLNEKAEPVRNVMNSVKDTTTSTIQQGKETVSNVAHATVNKASDVADSVYAFCERHVPGKTVPVDRLDFARRTTLLWERIKSTIELPIDYLFRSIQFLTIWLRMLILFSLMKLKQINDIILNQIQRKSFIFLLSQQLFIRTGSILENIMEYIRPKDHADIKHRQNRTGQQKQQFVSRPTLKPGAFLNTSQSNPITKPETPSNRNALSKQKMNLDELYSRLPTDNIQQSASSYNELSHANKTDKLQNQLSRLTAKATSAMDSREMLIDEQNMLQATTADGELEREDYNEEADYGR